MPHVFNSAEVQFWTALRFWLKFCQPGKIKGWKRPGQLLSQNKAPVGTQQAPRRFVFLLTPVPLPAWGYPGLHVSILLALAQRLDKKSEACSQHARSWSTSLVLLPTAWEPGQTPAERRRGWLGDTGSESLTSGLMSLPRSTYSPFQRDAAPSPVPPEPSLQLLTVMPNLRHTTPTKSCSQRVTKPSEVFGTLQFPCWWAPQTHRAASEQQHPGRTTEEEERLTSPGQKPAWWLLSIFWLPSAKSHLNAVR